jgi:hypothetical protein
MSHLLMLYVTPLVPTFTDADLPLQRTPSLSPPPCHHGQSLSRRGYDVVTLPARTPSPGLSGRSEFADNEECSQKFATDTDRESSRRGAQIPHALGRSLGSGRIWSVKPRRTST